MTTTVSPIHNDFSIKNIKDQIHILLNLKCHNHDTWREVFTIHYEAYETFDRIGETYDDRTPQSTYPQWKKVDVIIYTWLYMNLSQNLVNNVIKTKGVAPQIFLNVEKLFRDNKDSCIM